MAINSAAFLSVTEPPYRILVAAAASAETLVPNHSLISA